MEINTEKAQQLLDAGMAEAEEVIKSPSQVDEILIQVEEKLKTIPAIGSTLADLPLMIAMVKGWVTKEYTNVSPKVIACLVGSFIYLVKQKDLISDKIPIIGLADDLGVLALALKLSEPELKAFSAWRAGQGAGVVTGTTESSIQS